MFSLLRYLAITGSYSLILTKAAGIAFVSAGPLRCHDQGKEGINIAEALEGYHTEVGNNKESIKVILLLFF
ncbi:hypothetical protein A7975_29905 [Bacillus sp. FJAT-26390]|nr:hypothetical protein A7975_29905 [Bacillus sp. FJAT-26390]